MSADNSDTTAPPAALARPEPDTIAGFWRRILALLIDMALLACVGIAIGGVAFRQVAALGQSGRLIGAAIALAYFGVLNSRPGGGATPGKRWLGLEVVGRDGNPVPLARSLVRTVVFWTPYYLNGLYFSQIHIPGQTATQVLNAIVAVLLAVIVFGGMGLIVYLYVFNRRTRQSLHDLVAGTFVVRREGVSRPVEARFWMGHLAIAGGCGLLVLLIGVAAWRYIWFSQTGATLRQLTKLAETLNARPGVEAAQAQITTFYTSSMTRTALVINVRLLGVPDSLETRQDEIAGEILRTNPLILGTQGLGINVSYGYDLGIFTWTYATRYTATPEAWLQRMNAKGVHPSI